MVDGGHQSMVKVVDADSTSVRLLLSVLTDAPTPEESVDQLAFAAQVLDANTPAIVEHHSAPWTGRDIVNAALALEQHGKRDEATALLQRHQSLGTDVQGTLAGRIQTHVVL